MQIHSIAAVDIVIEPGRQRKIFDDTAIIDLAASITKNGLIHPVVIRQCDGEHLLVAGERRLKALDYIWNFGDKVNCGEYTFDEGQVPCLFLGEIDPVDAYEIELEENIRRENISWQDKAQATARLLALRNTQAQAQNLEEVDHVDLAREITGVAESTPSSEIHRTTEALREDLILARSLGDADVAKASTRSDALKVIKRKEEAQRHIELSRTVGAIFTSSLHTLLRGDCLSILPTLPEASFDVILSDPPYGIDAQDFNNSGGLAGGGSDGSHFYDDSYPSWQALVTPLARESFRLAKPQAHLYLFCDIDRFHELRSCVAAAGWTTFRTPLIWHNPGGMRAPWPSEGPQRKYQVILYANKGKRPVTQLRGDILNYPNDPNQGHPAQKPVALLADLLRRSALPGDSVLDPFAGSGSIFPAAHGCKVKATGVELDEAAAGIAAKRLAELK